MKKLLSLLLAFCLCLTLIPTAAFAASDFSIEDGVLKRYNGPGGDVVIPDGVTTIGNNAFGGRENLTSVTIPDSVTSIKARAFQGCTGLTSVTIPDSVTSIWARAFQGCTSLTSVTIPGGVTIIGDDAFNGCTGLTGVTIGNGVTSIGSRAFCGCASLTSMTIPDGVTSIGYCAFNDCTSLTSVTIPDSVTNIGQYAFRGCTKLTAVSVPGGAKVASDTFPSTTKVNLTGHYFDIQDGVLKRYNGPGGRVVIPEGVTEISEWAEPTENRVEYHGAFESCGEVTEVVIPNSVTTISDRTFYNCTGLTSLALPDSVTTISMNYHYDDSFDPPRHLIGGCKNLRFLEFGKGLAELPNIDDCPDLTTLIIPEGVTKCGTICTNGLRELTLPSTLENRPTLRCPELRKLVLPTNSWAFKGISRADFLDYISGCPKLEEIGNCPNEYMDDLIAPNAALRDNWKDPRSTIVSQSTRITKLSNELTAGCTTDYDKAKAISQWVVDHINYDDDYYYAGLKDYSDVPFDPEEILDKGQAVCAGFARLTQALLVAQDIPCLYVLGWTSGGYHAWNLALIDGDYLWIDNTWGMDYFGLGIYAISKDHTATNGASFNGVKGPGTVVNISEETGEGRLEISADRLGFDTVREGYQQPAARTLTVRNTGSKAVTLTKPTAVNFEVGRLSCTTLNAGETATFTVRPKAGLKANGTAARSYDETLTVRGDNDLMVKLELTFTVEPTVNSLAGVSDWAQPYVAQAIELGILPQDLQSLYDQATTRQEFCVLADNLYLALMGHYPNTGNQVTFTDTADKYVLDMARASVVSGVGGGRFEPDRSLEREEAATLLSQFALAVNKPLDSHSATFADKAGISDWALPFVGAMQKCGVMKGVGGNRFDPHGDYTREQSVVTIMLMYELLK